MKNHPRSHTRLSASEFHDLLKILLILSIIPLALLFYALRVKDQIETQAEQIADGEPYCILIPKRESGYRPAEHFTDTMGLLMRGSNAQNHAVLVVGHMEYPKTYHWSYFNFDFEEGALTTGRREDCIGYKFDYDNLAPSDYSETAEIMMGKTAFHVPLVYQPYDSNYGTDYLGFVVQIPSFTPVKDRYRNMLHVSPNRGKPLHLLPDTSREQKHFRTLTDYGLKISPSQTDRIAPGPDTEYGIYYANSDEGDIATIISCTGPETSNCLVRFDQGEWRYAFSLMPADLPRWRHTRRRVVEFVDSFAAAQRTTGVTPETAR